VIYISTGGYTKWTCEKAIEFLSRYGFNAFELSGGKHLSDIAGALSKLSKKQKIVLHNYFPPPREPFVFNLASLQHDIVEKSMLHAKFAIDLSSEIGSKYYSFHAGYLIDPGSNELGGLIKVRKLNDRNECKRVFIDRVNELSRYAASKKVRLMIENNVLSSENYHEFKNNAFLMVDPEETSEILEKTDYNVGLLIDVAHLKVSAKSLGFSATDYLVDFSANTWGYHLSDNDGLRDTNYPVEKNSWFWKNIKKNLDYYSLEIYNVEPNELCKQLDLVNNYLN
jgi:sugar phosphate isomerase/epimerase